jgi:hypothetical protein
MAETTDKGPNDARRDVWALGEWNSFHFVFFCVNHYFIVYLGRTKLLKYMTERRLERRDDG